MAEATVALVPLYRYGVLGGYALIDKEDCELVDGQSWTLDGKGYARHSRTLLHQLIMGIPPGQGREIQCDHINGIPTDNRKANMRIVTNAENAQNRRARSGLRGTSQRPNGTWIATVGKKYLGVYQTEEEAAAVTSAYRAQTMPFSAEERYSPIEPIMVAPVKRERKLTMDQVREIRRALDEGVMTKQALATQYDVTRSLIRAIGDHKIYREENQ